jgi:hypothetical protein
LADNPVTAGERLNALVDGLGGIGSALDQLAVDAHLRRNEHEGVVPLRPSSDQPSSVHESGWRFDPLKGSGLSGVTDKDVVGHNFASRFLLLRAHPNDVRQDGQRADDCNKRSSLGCHINSSLSMLFY